MAAPIYVRSGASSGGDGSSWALAYQSLATPLATAPTTQTAIWVSEDHTETLASATTLAAGASQALITNILCVNHTTGALATGAVISTANTTNLTLTGFAYCVGVSFVIGAGSSGTASILGAPVASDWVFENGSVKLNNSGTASVIAVGAAALVPYRLSFINTPIIFGSAGQTVRLYGTLVLKGSGTVISGSTGAAVPTNLITPLGYNTLSVSAEGADLSALTAGSKYPFVTSAVFPFQATLKDCKLSALPTGPAGASSLVSGLMSPLSSINVIRSAPAGTAGNFIEQRHSLEGVQVDETSITLTGGTTDGTTLKSRKITTSASASVGRPHDGSIITVWNANTTNAMTVALQGIWDASAVPNDNDLWLEVEYLADSGDMLGGFVSSNLSTALQAGNPLAAGTGTWANTSGMTSPKKFVLTAPNFTPAQAGFLTLRLKVAKPSITLYVDPKPNITVSGGTFPAISRSLVLPSGALMHETGSVTTTTVTQIIPMVRRVRR